MCLSFDQPVLPIMAHIIKKRENYSKLLKKPFKLTRYDGDDEESKYRQDTKIVLKKYEEEKTILKDKLYEDLKKIQLSYYYNNDEPAQPGTSFQFDQSSTKRKIGSDKPEKKKDEQDIIKKKPTVISDKILEENIPIRKKYKPGRNNKSTPTVGSGHPGLQECSLVTDLDMLDSNEEKLMDNTLIEKVDDHLSTKLISEAGSNTSSGYNSCGNERMIKSKRDSDTQSSSSTSDSVDLNTSTYKNNQTPNLNDSNNTKINKIIIKEKKKYYDPDDGEKFHEAVRNGDTAVVVELIENGLIKDLNEPDWNVSGDPPLLVAATNHHLSILSLLLANGCNPGARSPRGETALHRAIINGHIGDTYKFVEELLNYGCSAGVKEAGGGLTALHMLTKQLSHAQTLRGLLKNDFDEALKTFELLAKAGAVNDKDHQGRSALHILASSTAFDNNHRKKVESLVKILLDCGADTTLKNDRGETPLHESLEFGALNTADILISKTPTGLISRYGESPLHIAAKKNHTEIVDKLLKHGENSSLQNTEGNSPLHLASARGFHQIVSLLLTSSLNDIEQLNDDGLTALQVAAESGFANTVKVLINSGADPSVIDCTSTVIQHRHPDISKIIHNELTRRQQLAT